MTDAEKLFHCSQDLRTRTRVEVNKYDVCIIQEAIVIGDRIDNIFRNVSWTGFRSNTNGNRKEGQSPIQMRNIKT